MCGVLIAKMALKWPSLGSSPHVRGFGVDRRHGIGVFRFIPACAGFWLMYWRVHEAIEVHPRMCGVLVARR